MTLSRKEFFRQGFLSLGETLLNAGASVRGVRESMLCLPSVTEPESIPLPDGNLLATVDNMLCLARSCGCFSCVERCESLAISIVMGEGIRIDEALCSGCGICEYVCPMTPKAMTIVARGR